MRIDMEAMDVKLVAAGRWSEIIPALGGIDGEFLNGKHHPCPLCGGTDRFRAFSDFRQTGGVICNQCHDLKNGDGLATLQWACGWSFSEAISQVANYLGLEGAPAHRGALARYCEAKSIPEDSLRKFGAIDCGDGTTRVPMYGANGRPCSEITFGLGSDKLKKGLYSKGKPVGIFWTGKPKPGDTVVLVEGVKDAAALDAIGVQAVGLPGSSLSAELAPLLVGCTVVILPDLDEAGTAGAAKSLAAVKPFAKSATIAKLPGNVVATGGDGVREVLKSHGADAIRKALKVTPIQTGPRVTTVTDASMAYLEKLRAGDEQLISTGFVDLDEAIGGGVSRGEMVVIAARPSHGKSAMALQWLLDAADGGFPGVFITQEMSAQAIAKRCLLNQTRMTAGELKESTLAAAQVVESQVAQQSPIHIVEGCADIAQVVDQVDEAVDRLGVEVAAIDYLQLIRESSGNSRYEQVTNVSQRLRDVATRNNIVVVALAQLGRAVESRPDRIPMLSDLKESGQIEQDADVALLLSWPWRFDDTYPHREEFRVVIAKNRNREIRSNRVVLDWQPEYQRFAEKEPEVYEEFSTYVG